ncbi:Rv1733c family protein [Mycolicibacterium baixiangningiae]|uniref:Rv1733c family protein n=1 Tax=Mycolicibacterium baixiangningiae TaxID=2761578 RepID=UPI001865B798|nr:hypothetical protein [Mycolicibacterium baixiangningiae]
MTAAPPTEETFEIRLPRWPLLLRLFNRAPLVRPTDRIEALVVGLAVVVALLALPVAAAIGTAVYDSRSHHYAEQTLTSHSVTATITEVPDSPPLSRTGLIAVPVQWWDAGTRHTGIAQAPASVAVGDPVDLWVDADGVRAFAPTPTTRAAVEGVAAAVGIWVSVAAGAAIVATIVQLACDRIRFTAWQDDLDSLVGNDGGHTTRRS